MAFVLQIERQFPLDRTYQGPEAWLEFEFSFFFPRGADDLALILDAALFSINVLPVIQLNYLRYTIESDNLPRQPDRYRVSVVLAGEVEASQGTIDPLFAQIQAPQAIFAPVTIIAIAIAVGIALVFASIAWRTFTVGLAPTIFGIGKGAIVPGLLTLGAVGLGLYFVFGRQRINA